MNPLRTSPDRGLTAPSRKLRMQRPSAPTPAVLMRVASLAALAAALGLATVMAGQESGARGVRAPAPSVRDSGSSGRPAEKRIQSSALTARHRL